MNGRWSATPKTANRLVAKKEDEFELDTVEFEDLALAA